METAELKESDFVELSLSRLSQDGEGGFPVNLDIAVKYKLTKKNEVILDYSAITDKDTPVVLTNHTYFNLNRENSGKDVLDTILTVDADKCLPLDKNSIPTGTDEDVSNTPMDLRKPAKMGRE